MAKIDRNVLGETRLSRRAVMKLIAATAGTVSVGGIIAACGPDDAEEFNATARAQAGGGQGEHGSSSPGQASSSGGSGATHHVEMNDQFHYVPDQLTISVGDTVTWTTTGFIPHTVTCDASMAANPDEHVKLPDGAEPFHSGDVAQNAEWSYTFQVAGDYTYFCVPHEMAGMIGHLTVEG